MIDEKVFRGGTSVQEYDNRAATPTMEYIRGSDYGGGVGGILYTIRSGVPSFTHENRRGDVVSKTDATGAITYQAQYQAFGKRTQETGSTQDRQKANSKDEDPTGLLNEGFRYRDLETGSFITRDPAGMIDGPNEYCYVRQNPWTSFDPEGLSDSDGTTPTSTPPPPKKEGIPANIKQKAEEVVKHPLCPSAKGVFETKKVEIDRDGDPKAYSVRKPGSPIQKCLRTVGPQLLKSAEPRR